MSDSLKFHYTTRCVPSSEVRGRRPEFAKGCERSSHRSTHKEISDTYHPQSKPCWYCTKRQRLTPCNTEYFFTKEDAVRTAFNENARFLNEHIGEDSPEDFTE